MNYDINTFVDELIEAKNLAGVDAQILEQMKKDLLDRVENRINAVIATNMPESAQAEFEKLIDSDSSDEEVTKFCSDKIPNLTELVSADLVQFRGVYLGN
jgi:predicted DNA-binding protein (UPF0278 family)